MNIPRSIYGRRGAPLGGHGDARDTMPGRQMQDSGRRNSKPAKVVWYGRFLIITMLLVAAGWELFRWIIAIMTLD